MFDSEHENAYNQLEDVFEIMPALNEEVAAARNDTGPSEAEIWAIVRDDLEEVELLNGAK